MHTLTTAPTSPHTNSLTATATLQQHKQMTNTLTQQQLHNTAPTTATATTTASLTSTKTVRLNGSVAIARQTLCTVFDWALPRKCVGDIARHGIRRAVEVQGGGGDIARLNRVSQVPQFSVRHERSYCNIAGVLVIWPVHRTGVTAAGSPTRPCFDLSLMVALCIPCVSDIS